MINGHPTVTVEHPDGYSADIDTLIADLIRECWRLGIDTSECCQEEGHGMARVGFLTLTDMERFYEVVTRKDDDEALFFAWKWELWADGGLRGTVHFPASQIRWLTRCLSALKVEVEHA